MQWMCQHQCMRLRSLKGSLLWLDSPVFTPVCVRPRAFALHTDVSLLPVQLSSAAPGFSSTSNFHLCSNATFSNTLSPTPPPPHPALRHSSAGRYSSARSSTLLNDGWRMSNTAPAFRSFFFVRGWLTPWTSLSLKLCHSSRSPLLPPLLGMHASRPESWELS